MPGSRLSLEERIEVAVGLARGDSDKEIGDRLERDRSTIWRERRRNSNRRAGYSALGAQRKADLRAGRPKARRLEDEALRQRVRGLLVEERHSPMTTSKLLGRQGVTLSHETIYEEIYRGTFGDPRRVLCRPRKSRRRRTRTGRYPDNLGDYRPLSTRVADVTSEPGHWEGDLLVGHDNLSAVVVLTERVCRICLLGALPLGRGADHAAEVVISLLGKVPPQLRRSLTWDQGRELTRWPRIEEALGIPVYFTQPRAPWQKPLVENQNGLLRRWLPRSQPMPNDQTTLDVITHRLNGTPRRILHWDTATETYHQLTLQ
jgi:IS30 family transposase